MRAAAAAVRVPVLRARAFGCGVFVDVYTLPDVEEGNLISLLHGVLVELATPSPVCLPVASEC